MEEKRTLRSKVIKIITDRLSLSISAGIFTVVGYILGIIGNAVFFQLEASNRLNAVEEKVVMIANIEQTVNDLQKQNISIINDVSYMRDRLDKIIDILATK